VTFELPVGFDVDAWVSRWDWMQERCLVAREQRLAELARLVRAAVGEPRLVLDLGCGTGSVARVLLEAFPGTEVVGVDVDPALLALARGRCDGFQGRTRFVEADLRGNQWIAELGGRPDAAVSATALHWLGPEALAELYGRLALALAPGAVLLNADHVASSIPGVQEAWCSGRRQALRSHRTRGEEWGEFWEAFLGALGPSARAAREAALGGVEDGDDGMPLAWHLDALRQVGFTGVDCFWRCDTDAIYGGVLPRC